jgi:hypothetical protein
MELFVIFNFFLIVTFVLAMLSYQKIYYLIDTAAITIIFIILISNFLNLYHKIIIPCFMYFFIRSIITIIIFIVKKNKRDTIKLCLRKNNIYLTFFNIIINIITMELVFLQMLQT